MLHRILIALALVFCLAVAFGVALMPPTIPGSPTVLAQAPPPMPPPCPPLCPKKPSEPPAERGD